MPPTPGSVGPAHLYHLGQDAFRGREDTVSLDSSTFTYAKNANWSQRADSPFRVRFSLVETFDAVNVPSGSYVLYYSLNGGSYYPVESTTPIKYVASAQYADGDTIASQLLGSTPDFAGGDGNEDATSVALVVNAAGSAEFEYCVQLDSAQVSTGDVIRLRILDDDTYFLDYYTYTPEITVYEISSIVATTAGSSTIAFSGRAKGKVAATSDGVASITCSALAYGRRAASFDLGSSSFTATVITTFVTSQSDYRFRLDNAGEASGTWAAAVKTDYTTGFNRSFRVRIQVKASQLGVGSVSAFKWQFRHDSGSGYGSWTDLSSSSTPIKGYNGAISDGVDCVQRLTAVSGATFITDNNGGRELTSTFTPGSALSANTYLETEHCLYFDKAYASVADLVQFRIVSSGGTPLDAYDYVPTVTIRGRLSATTDGLSTVTSTVRGRMMSFSVDGAASITAAGLAKWFIHTSYAGSSSAVGSLRAKGKVAGLFSSSFSSTSRIQAITAISASFAGSSTAVCNVRGRVQGISSILGTTSIATSIRGKSSLVSSAAGVASVTVVGSRRAAIRSVVAGTFSLTCRGTRIKSFSAVAAGSSGIQVSARMRASISAEFDAFASIDSYIDGLTSIRATFSGTSLQTAKVSGRTSRVFSFAGTSNFYAHLYDSTEGNMQFSTAGMSSVSVHVAQKKKGTASFEVLYVSVAASVQGRGRVLSAVPGTSSVSATLSGKGPVASVIHGSCDFWVKSDAKAYFEASTSASGLVEATVKAKGSIRAVFSASASFEASPSATGHVTADLDSTSSIGAYLSAEALFSAATAGSTAVSVDVGLRGSISVAITSSSSITPRIQASGKIRLSIISGSAQVFGSPQRLFGASFAGSSYVSAYIGSKVHSSCDLLSEFTLSCEVRGRTSCSVSTQGGSVSAATIEGVTSIQTSVAGVSELVASGMRFRRTTCSFESSCTVNVDSRWVGHTYVVVGGTSLFGADVEDIGKFSIHTRSPMKYVFGSLRAREVSECSLRPTEESEFELGRSNG